MTVYVSRQKQRRVIKCRMQSDAFLKKFYAIHDKRKEDSAAERGGYFRSILSSGRLSEDSGLSHSSDRHQDKLPPSLSSRRRRRSSLFTMNNPPPRHTHTHTTTTAVAWQLRSACGVVSERSRRRQQVPHLSSPIRTRRLVVNFVQLESSLTFPRLSSV